MSKICNKSQQLGMSFSKASARLWKKVIFQLIQQANRDICYRCGKSIEKVDDISLDHKQPWLFESNDLFWDLNNIDFSHRSCNYRSIRRKKPS